MPELPEVEAARRAVETHCKGGLICRAVVADDTTVVEGVLPFDMQRSLVGKRIVSAHRKGKQLWLQMDEPPRMAGAVYIKGVKSTQYVRSAVKDEDEWPSKYSKVLLVLDTGVEMSFTDKRRFARIRLLENPSTSPPVSELGPDAFTELPDETDFANLVTKKKTSIKAILLDQSFLAGIGNWIADEVLYQSRIHPEQPASSLTVDDCKRLRSSISEVVMTAVDVDANLERFPRDWIFHHRWNKKPGSVIETAVTAEADSAEYPKDWIAHHRDKKSADASVNGKKIEFITVGGRTSAYVPELQKYDGVRKKKKVISRKKQNGDEDDDDGEKDDEAEKKIAKGKAKGKAVKEQKTSLAETEKPKRSRGRPAKTKVTAEKPSSGEDESDGGKRGSKRKSERAKSSKPRVKKYKRSEESSD